MMSKSERKREKLRHSTWFSRILFMVLLPAGILLLLLIIVWIFFHPGLPDMNSISQTLKAINKVRHLKADVYATEMSQQVEKSWDSLLQEWRRENRRFILRRDYARIDSLAQETLQIAQLCARQTQILKDSLKNAIKVQTVLVTAEVNGFKKKYRELPSVDSFRFKLLGSEMLLSESQAALEREDYKRAHNKIIEATHLLGQSQQAFSDLIGKYLLNLPDWNQWVDETIKWSSEKKATVIIIDKLEHLCKVYEGGILKLTLPAEFGPNWIGHKRVRGDDATPEGRYFVKTKKSGAQTKYFLALEIDYPNDQDQEQFKTAKKNGELPKGAQIGSLIEIHGGGGEGVNWTNGCVALNNEDMQKVFELASVGTPVTIVGTLSNRSANKTEFTN